LFDRFYTLAHILNQKEFVLITTFEALFLKIAPKAFFNKSFKIAKDDIISPYDLAAKLTEYGYSQAPSVEEPGTFCSKGEIFDIYPMTSGPVRIQYFDDLIEDIFQIDKETLKTIKDKTIDEINFNITPLSMVN